MNKKNNNNNKEKREKIEIYGPSDLYHLDVNEIVEVVKSNEVKTKISKKSPTTFEHYYTPNPTSELKIKKLLLKLKSGREYYFDAPTGVYGKSRIDKATRILIENCNIYGQKILDIGCGYGVIGITIKKEYPDKEVYMSDINKRAVNFAKKNSKDNNALIDVKEGDLFDPWKKYSFDVILSNPPIVAGKEIWKDLINDSYQFLNIEGSIQLVAYHNKGGSSIKDYMKKTFGNVYELIKTGGIRVYKSIKEA